MGYWSLKATYLRASKDILPVPYGSSFSSNALLVKDFLMLLLEVLLLKEDLAKEVKRLKDILASPL